MNKNLTLLHRARVWPGRLSRGAGALALCLSLFLIAGGHASVGAESGRAMEFELQDQFGSRLAYRFPKDRVSVLTFGDRNGAAQIEGWVQPVHERYHDRVDLHGVAVLTSIPKLFHNYARGQFRKKMKYPVLLDFKGDVARGYGYEGDKANIFVIGRDGAVKLKLTGPATADGLNRVYAEVDRLLASGS